ncbi:PTS mannitol transporter subunit IICB [Candidatus Galacturonibacter soehngenii]|uniref:PTS system mannitol-specific EIICB component n=1 Tax=Candidatus Galacturonatibacter soehngenii TaxID=2307010 RepID=A0A7V7QK36_9FIRM|nr:PTS mannitol transporter subunit IICBA [Candidatus Galacturonibacter soehngenii]KAB1437961.1 PTS mannitol transporter subunit IICBA [Candidatus Galacturonibacter soehngenii]MBA4688973.1 PTS mannitol transporter subunit IICBA [Candidatus Galacturonibacter soehngenii]
MKERIQTFGRALSGMVMPNIGAFIAWGFITALFIPTGWLPNEKLAELVGPMASYLLTILIAYTGGKNVAGVRGGVIGAIATMGVIVGADVPMFLGAMLMGPLSGYLIKKLDKAVENKIPAGFEMLFNNFSLGILGAILALIGYAGVSPIVSGLNTVMEMGVGFFVNHGILPLVSLFIEPAKILFLNNAVNHGILSPMGMQQAAETGKSIFFLLEANPGPGLGILLAYCLAGKGDAKSSAPGAIIIHFLGGIHEIYFPYILMNPILLLAAIAGGASGVFTLSIFGAGLAGPASPGSIFAVLGMTARDSYLGVILSVIISCAVSCIVAIPLLKAFGRVEDLEAAKEKVKEMKDASKGLVDLKTAKNVKSIVFACDAGMGSSAMGATILKKKLASAGLNDISVVHASVSSIPEGAQVVVTHEELKERAASSCPGAKLVLIKNFMSAPEYDLLVEELKL